jgi:hypothetical protein
VVPGVPPHGAEIARRNSACPGMADLTGSLEGLVVLMMVGLGCSEGAFHRVGEDPVPLKLVEESL